MSTADVDDASFSSFHPDGEELQFYFACEPLAGVSAAVCCLIDSFFEDEEGKTGASLPSAEAQASLDWSPTADEGAPKDLLLLPNEEEGMCPLSGKGITEGKKSEEEISAAGRGLSVVPVTRFTESLVDAHYLCSFQNPLNLLLHLPAKLILHLLTANLLPEILLTLLLKVEAYTLMGAPALPGRPPDPLAPEEIVQLQVCSSKRQGRREEFSYVHQPI